ncbi:MAG: hypothetical protein ACRC6T_01045 [Sarcina sp.]
MNYGRDELNDPMYREYIETIDEDRILESIENRELENEIFEEEENVEIRNEDRIIGMEGFNPINNELVIDNGLIENRIVEADGLYSFEKELELEEDMDIIQEDRGNGW